MTTMYLTYSPHNQINIKHFINKWNSYQLEAHHIPGYSDLNQKECLNWKKKPKIYLMKMKGSELLCLQNVMYVIYIPNESFSFSCDNIIHGRMLYTNF